MEEKTLKPGMIVRIRADLEYGDNYNLIGVNRSMANLKGQKTVITAETRKDVYHILADDNSYYWHKDMFDLSDIEELAEGTVILLNNGRIEKYKEGLIEQIRDISEKKAKIRLNKDVFGLGKSGDIKEAYLFGGKWYAEFSLPFMCHLHENEYFIEEEV